MTSGTILSPKNCSIRVLIPLIFYCVFLGTASIKRIYLKHQIFVVVCLILMMIFQNSPNKLDINSASKKDCVTSFSRSFLCLKMIAETSKIKKRKKEINLSPSSTLSLPLPKSQKEVISGAKVIEGPEAAEDLHW